MKWKCGPWRIRFSIAFSILIITAALIFTTPARAQQTYHRFTVNIGGGYTPTTGDIGKRLTDGWDGTAGAGFNFNRHFSLGGQVMYDSLGVSQLVLNEAAVPAANAHVWAITVEPTFRFLPGRVIDPYFVGGVGYYRQTVQFTQPTYSSIFVFDPFFGFYPALIQTDQVLGTMVGQGIGGSAGMGLNFRLGDSGLKFYVEARYHYADTGSLPLRMIPVNIGFRW
jgi:Outer membrane protein beta-barrel domain